MKPIIMRERYGGSRAETRSSIRLKRSSRRVVLTIGGEIVRQAGLRVGDRIQISETSDGRYCIHKSDEQAQGFTLNSGNGLKDKGKTGLAASASFPLVVAAYFKLDQVGDTWSTSDLSVKKKGVFFLPPKS